MLRNRRSPLCSGEMANGKPTPKAKTLNPDPQPPELRHNEDHSEDVSCSITQRQIPISGTLLYFRTRQGEYEANAF
jgi:hypothetical protein